MFDMDIFSDVTTNFGFGELFPQLIPSHDSEWNAQDFSWTTEEKRQKTNDTYADFDCCINPQLSQVMEPRTPITSSTPDAIQEGGLHCIEEIAAECSSLPTVIEQSNEFKKEGLLLMANNQTMQRQKKLRKRNRSDLDAEENMAVSNNERISTNVNVQEFQKPIFPYSCLIAMALKNSKTDALLVSQIYIFICEHFPYYKTAPIGWKNCIRHTLSLNKHFIKHECGNEGKQKRYTWSLDPSKAHEIDKLICEWSHKDTMVKHLADTESVTTKVRQRRFLL